MSTQFEGQCFLQNVKEELDEHEKLLGRFILPHQYADVSRLNRSISMSN